MNLVVGISALVAVAATVMVITRRSAVHALLYLVVSLLAAAVIMFLLGAAFVAALEVIIYAGAIMVLFVFVIMLIGPEPLPVPRRAWIGPSALGIVLLGELVWVLAGGTSIAQPAAEIGPRQVGIALFGPYIIGAEIAAFLLLAGLVGAFHLGRRISTPKGRQLREAQREPLPGTVTDFGKSKTGLGTSKTGLGTSKTGQGRSA